MPSEIDRAIMRRQQKRDEEAISRIVLLLEESLDWLDDYDLRMRGSAKLADRIRDELERLR